MVFRDLRLSAELRAQSSGRRAQGAELRAQSAGRRAQGAERRKQGAGLGAQSAGQKALFKCFAEIGDSFT